MSEARIAYLVSRINNQAITTAEREEFLELVKQSGNEAVVKQELENLLLSGDVDFRMNKEAADAVVEAILSSGGMVAGAAGNDVETKLDKDQEISKNPMITEMPGPGKEEEKRKERKVIGMWRWMAAAVVVLIAVGVWWMADNNKARVESGTAVVPMQKGQDIPPGKEGAILTLADGTRIVLDSAGNGALASQGNTSIVKEGGKIRYQVGGEAGEGQVVYNTMSTPRGRQYSLWLSDGTRVWLNAASSIRFPAAFTGHTREVEITGEAYFEVAHNASKPFHVKKGDVDVTVLGTHFNVNAYDDEESLAVTLLEGSVKVTATGNSQLKANSQQLTASLIIRPGQQAVLTNSYQLTANSSVDLDEVMAWKNGYFQFENASLQQVMRQLERWYNVDVVYRGQVPSREFVGTMSRNTSLAGVLKILEANNVRFTIEGRKIIVGN